MQLLKYFVIFTVLSCIGATGVPGATTVLGDPADITIDSNFIGDGTLGWIGVSADTPASLGAGYFFFQLPEPDPSDLPIVSAAAFSFKVQTAQPVQSFALDLYGLGVRSSPLVDFEAEHYVGANDGSATKIQDDLVPTGNEATGWFSTDLSGSVNLADYLTDQYGTNRENAGQYVLLRLNPDASFTPSPGTAGVLVHFAGLAPEEGETVEMTPEQDRPRLSLEFAAVPEPIALAWPLLALLYCGRRR